MIIDNLQFKTKPWEHQLLALKYLMAHKCAGLYTDMGTGKSKIIIDLIVNKGFDCVLIVCTERGCEVWQEQFARHSNIGPENVLNLMGVPTPKKVLATSEKFTQRLTEASEGPLIIIVNYAGVWRQPFADYLMQKTVKIDCIVCDESHRIKSPGSKCSRFLTRIGHKVDYRYLVTGTPLAENPMDVYAQYRFLDPSIFGTSFAKFKDRYQNLDTRKSMAVGFPVLDKKQPYKNLDELQEKVFSIAFKMSSSIKLPKQNNRIQKFCLSKKASDVYIRMSKEGIITCGDWYCEAENALTKQIRKKQITSGFVSAVNYNTNEKKCFKLDDTRKEVLKDILESLGPTEPIVIFAQYTYDLKQIKKACQEIGYSYSELSGKVNTESEWQKGKASVLGVQFSKGSESADFTRARYAIYYSMTNSLALYLQSKKRIHRPGQTKPVFYIHLVAEQYNHKPTIDSTIIKAVQLKKDIVDYIMETEE